MADEKNNASGASAGPSSSDRDFAPLTDIGTGTSEADSSSAEKKRSRPRGMPTARVNPGMVREFEEEIETKVKSGTSRMRWFANHLILFVVGIAGIIPLRLTILTDYHDAWFYVPIGAWVGLLALHARFAMGPILRKSRRESQIKAVVPNSGESSSEQD